MNVNAIASTHHRGIIIIIACQPGGVVIIIPHMEGVCPNGISFPYSFIHSPAATEEMKRAQAPMRAATLVYESIALLGFYFCVLGVPGGSKCGRTISYRI